MVHKTSKQTDDPKLLEFRGRFIPDFELFLETKKACDKFWHDGLLKKIKPHLPDTYFRLILSYLTNRTYSVKIENSVSNSFPIKFGVPQGSVPGPFLYIFFTHDFPTSPHITFAQFADDMTALCKALSNQLAAIHIQHFAHAMTT